MPVPDFQSLMLPALKALAGGREALVSEVREHIAVAECLTVDDLREMLPSGRQSVFVNRVSWAVILSWACRFDRTGTARSMAADGGRREASGRSAVPHQHELPTEVSGLCRMANGKNEPTSPSDAVSSISDGSTDTPEEALEKAARQLRRGIGGRDIEPGPRSATIFSRTGCHPLLIAMGYGGGDAAMGRVTGALAMVGSTALSRKTP